MKGSSIPLTGSRHESSAEPLYQSPTTRVFRSGPVHASVILKEMLGADAAQRLHRERTILAHLAKVHGIARLAEGPHAEGTLTLQDCGGVPLAELLRAGALDLDVVLALALQLAQSVAAMHRAGVIHRDINPANILRTNAGEAMLIDFDLAVLADQRAELSGGIVGTLGYLAPEQSGRTGRAVDQRADLYALGVTLYEMATGQLPFEAQDALQLVHGHLVREPDAPSQVNARVPRGLSDIILRLMAKAPEQRYQSAEGLLHDLARLRDDLAREGDGRFTLGERDFPARLGAPERLVGRDTERALLHAAFADALNTARRTVLVEGAPGVGKSALMHELRPVAAAAGGWFVHGKFDQYQREAAMAGAVTQALRALGRLLLTEPKDALDALRQRIRHALGRNASLATHALPEFELLLGEQPGLPEVDPRQAEARLIQATLDLLGAIASPQRPLVIVLDDLQWAGPLSLRIFERIMNAPQLPGVLLVGGYRGAEVGPEHALGSLLEQWRRQELAPACIPLQNLSPADLGELVGAVLRLPGERAEELAQAVGALTGGNPFDTLEMLNALRRDGALSLGMQGWQWESAAIRRFVGRSSVVDLLAVRIGRLPEASRAMLEAMSCLGSAVERALLQAALRVDAAQLGELLKAPLEDGLLVTDPADPDIVSFRHDRVQQAVLALLDPEQRGRIQLELARALGVQPGCERHAARQYLECIDRLADAHEQRRAARLFRDTAAQLADIANYALAERHLKAAAALLNALAVPHEPADASLRNTVDAELHVALYSLGRLEEMDALFEAVQAHTADPLELVESACLQMRSLDMRSRMDDAMQLGCALLARLGHEVPAGFDDPSVGRRLDALSEWAAQDSGFDPLARPRITDRRLLAIAKLLNRMVRSAFFHSDMQALAWLLLECQRLWEAHGPCAELITSLCRTSIMLIRTRQDYRTGFDIGRHVLTVGEALGFEPQTSEARAMHAAYSCYWFEPMEIAYENAVRAYEGVQAGGDISYSCYVHRACVVNLLDTAPTIQALTAEIENGMALCQRAGNSHAAAYYMCDWQMARALGGQTRDALSFDDEHFDEAAFLAQTADMPYVGLTYHARRALHAVLLGDPAALGLHADRIAALHGADPMTVDEFLCIALACAWRVQQHADSGSTVDMAPLLAELASHRQWLAARAADQPYNFLHLLRLVEAEEAWALGDSWKAATTFDAAVAEAQSRRRPWHRALITERAGLFHIGQGLAQTGRKLLADACDLYEDWGAAAKVTQMQRAHPFLQAHDEAPQPLHAAPASSRSMRGSNRASSNRAGGSGGVSSESLDLMGVLRASQALSSETSLERLTARVAEVLASLSGATKALVLLWSDGQWWLLAQGAALVSVAEAAQRGLLAASVVAYAERTGQALVVDDACSDDRFARDPYFTGVALCSLLVAPITGQGGGHAMLVLENRQGRAAFNAQRLDAVMLIAGQLAVSLANAQLYENLEQRVQARTRELQQMQAQLVTTARRAGMAEIANNVLHNVGNVLNSINVSANVVRRTIGESRAQGLARAVQLMNEHEADLGRFISEDTRGKNLLPYLNELVAALQAERNETLEDLQRLVQSVDHISYVVATQQSHAGPSSVLETAQPQELLEEALRLSEQPLAQYEVTVVRHYEPVAATLLDKPRLLQILVNLIRNAAQAMESVPEASRLLTLATLLVPVDGGQRLRITVQDSGEGIAAENLTRVFAHGFTTRSDGHGFGLHSSALAAMEMGAKLGVHSDGPGRGAVFTLEIPMAPSLGT